MEGYEEGYCRVRFQMSHMLAGESRTSEAFRTITVTPDPSMEMGENHYGFCGWTFTLPEWPRYDMGDCGQTDELSPFSPYQEFHTDLGFNLFFCVFVVVLLRRVILCHLGITICLSLSYYDIYLCVRNSDDKTYSMTTNQIMRKIGVMCSSHYSTINCIG